MSQKTDAVLSELGKVIVGKDVVMKKIFMAILASGHVLMEDVPGVGKTTAAMTFARVLGLETRRVQFTSDTVPSDIIGFSVYEKESGNFIYKPGAVMTNLLLADEINRTSSKTQSALLEAMEERRVTVDGVTYPLPQPFFVLATQNPAGSAGTQMLPNSQLDRFLIKISMGYPDFQSQVNILRERHTSDPLDSVSPVLTIPELNDMMREAAAVETADRIYEYVTLLAQKTREHPAVELGISPRGALAVCRMAKARAYLSDREYVIPEDVEAVFTDVCAHRLMLNAKARMMETDAARVIAGILADTPLPTLNGARL
ncbi:MAG: MoxR family ATPase [Oscillospiraceae bacterium]|nr:MoxR family ATPase [Oscillospiraceae bacterium]